MITKKEEEVNTGRKKVNLKKKKRIKIFRIRFLRSSIQFHEKKKNYLFLIKKELTT
jgi:hypothetical protein